MDSMQPGENGTVGKDGLPIKVLSKDWMEWLVKEECLDSNWHEKLHIHLDFSDSELFKLQEFKPVGFHWGGKPIKDAQGRSDRDLTTIQMPVHKLVSLNLNCNELKDTAFEFKEATTKSLTGKLFANLRILKMNDNLLHLPHIVLPQLRELYLSRNNLVFIPLLGGMPKLEVLVLSHNKINQINYKLFDPSDKQSKGGESASIPHLKTLDVSANLIDMDVKNPVLDMYNICRKFAKSLQLQVLILKDNPFCSYFSEYQLICVHALSDLEQLDDINLERNENLRKEMIEQADQYFGLQRLKPDAHDKEMHDKHDGDALRNHFKNLSKVIGERRNPQAVAVMGDERKRAPRIPTLPDLVTLLEDAIQEPKSASTYINLVFEDVCHLMKGGPDGLRKFIEADRKGNVREALVSFVQLSLILVERYPEHRMMMLKAIAKFSMVAEKPLAAIATLAEGGGAPMDEVMKVLEDNALSELARVSADSFRIVIIGLSQFDSDNEDLAEVIERFKLVGVLCSKLQQMIHQLLGESDPQGPFQAALLRVLRCAVIRRENALEAMSLCDELANRMSDEKEFHDKDPYSTGLFLDITEILQACIKVNTAKALADIQDSSRFPYRLIELCKKAFDTLKKSDTTDRLLYPNCKKIAAVIGVITAIMEDPTHNAELLRIEPGQIKDNALVKIVMRAPSESSTDPLILGASLDCCTHILLKAPSSVFQQYLNHMTIEMDLQKDNKILPYMEVKKFKDLYRRCQSHLAVTPAEVTRTLTATVPDFNGVTNRLVHRSIASIVRFLRVFSILEDDDGATSQTKELCKFISDRMNELGRDGCLLKLLEMPSDEVRQAVLECLSELDPGQLDPEEIDKLFDMLNPDDVKKEEELMGQILALFLKILSDDDESADDFCMKYAKLVLMKTIEILNKNAERNTHGVEQDEQQKAELSLRAVELFFVASKKRLVRQHMRSAEITMDFRAIILNEMRFNSEKVQDINLEISWTGRSVENLMACISGGERLEPNSRQGFRIINRIADVMEGGSDAFRRYDVSSIERATAEACMWKDSKMKQGITYVDDMEYDDRTNQQQSFVSFHAVNRLLTFLECHPVAIATQVGGNEGMDEVVVAKKEKHNGEDQILQAKDMLADIRTHAQAQLDARIQEERKEFAREEERLVEIDEPDEDEPEDHELVLRRCYLQYGYQISSRVQKAIGFSIPPQPECVKLDESYFMPGTTAEVSLVYPLAAVLRSLYSLLILPAVERLRLDMISTLRDVGLQSRMIALIEAHGKLCDCHIAAKYLRVMSLALRMAPDQTVMHMTDKTDKEYVLGLSMSASFAGRCLRLLTPLLSNMGRGYMLTLQQQTLCIESVRMLTVVSAASPYVKLSQEVEIQKECEEYLLTHLMPMSLVNSVILCLLYDMQVNVGSSHGSFINAKYVRSSMQRQNFRELCTETLCNILHACPAMQYEVFETFYKQETHSRVALRTSFLDELIKRVAQLKYVFAMEKMIQQKKFEPGERILRCCECEMPLRNESRFLIRSIAEAPRMLVLTSKRLLVMEKPKHGMLKQKCGHCPPESFCPVGPSIEIEHEFADMTRVIRGIDSQMFAIGWIQRGTSLTGPTITGESMDILICHRSDVRRGVIETLCTLSGPDVEKRVEPHRDQLIKQTIEKRLDSPPVCMTFAYRVETGKMCLFILCESDFCQVQIAFNMWIPPFEPIPCGDVSDDEDAMNLDGEQADPALLADENIKADKSRLTRRAFQTRAQNWLTGTKGTGKGVGVQYNSIWAHKPHEDVQQVMDDREKALSKYKNKVAEGEQSGAEGDKAASVKHVLQNVMRKARQNIFPEGTEGWRTWKMQEIEEIAFDAGEQPVLRLRFKGGSSEKDVSIRFLDDVGRERWRRGLAYILNKSDTAAQWQRKWDQEGKAA